MRSNLILELLCSLFIEGKKNCWLSIARDVFALDALIGEVLANVFKQFPVFSDKYTGTLLSDREELLTVILSLAFFTSLFA